MHASNSARIPITSRMCYQDSDCKISSAMALHQRHWRPVLRSVLQSFAPPLPTGDGSGICQNNPKLSVYCCNCPPCQSTGLPCLHIKEPEKKPSAAGASGNKCKATSIAMAAPDQMQPLTNATGSTCSPWYLHVLAVSGNVNLLDFVQKRQKFHILTVPNIMIIQWQREQFLKLKLYKPPFLNVCSRSAHFAHIMNEWVKHGTVTVTWWLFCAIE